ncbi:metal-dependent hydrolase [Candidatus Pantoea edessiphila]|uniref:Metal-dependent hydrolase n=1 Tax=Candidatus Pantoea edessiphila TaxID=2044610 RepID=A0A2P5T2G5_9GAMM|nr:metal-dependent hydrolase [Candidatus Pantoea edessiphila]PPI88794.1 metal-dependent hydrolase [Candidatus Pantoea edessiphila]
MTKNGHIIFAVTTAIFAKRFELNSVMIQADWWHLIPAVLISCLIPDIDHPNSLIGQKLRWIAQPISLTFGHRGFTHSLLALIILWLSKFTFFKNLVIPDDIFQGIILGYFSHIIADILTPAGVPLFWPYRKRFRFPIINNNKNKKIEKRVCFSLFGCVILFPMYFPLLVKYIALLYIKII